MAVPGWTVRLSAELTPNLGTVIGVACAQAALMVALAAWLRADVGALDGRANVLAERMGDLSERVARLEARPD